MKIAKRVGDILIISLEEAVLWIYLDHFKEWELLATIYRDNNTYDISDHTGNDLFSITQELYKDLIKNNIKIDFLELTSRVEDLNRASKKPRHRRHSK